MPHTAPSRPRWIGPALLLGGLAAILLVVLGVIGVIATQGAGQTSLAAIPTVAVLPSATVGAEETKAVAATMPALLPTEAPGEPAGRATLPPTWTVTPTLTPTATLTRTPIPARATRAPTLSPDQLADTYWEGDGEMSMWDVQFRDGSFARFTVFPINLWVGGYGGGQMTDQQEAAVDNAIREISQIVPIQRVEDRLFAHITLWLMTDEQFNTYAQCHNIETAVGCTSPIFTNVGILINTVWLHATDDCFADTLLHELTHALGLLVHSPNREDIMYFMLTCVGPHYSQRDLHTLRALYAAPAYNPREE